MVPRYVRKYLEETANLYAFEHVNSLQRMAKGQNAAQLPERLLTTKGKEKKQAMAGRGFHAHVVRVFNMQAGPMACPNSSINGADARNRKRTYLLTT